MRVPFLINRNPDLPYLKILKNRMNEASEVVSAQNPDALIIFVIDAADYSVTGAENCSPSETSFIHEFSKLGSLSNNIRLLFTTRTGRKDILNLPEHFHNIELFGFSLEETTKFVRNKWPAASDDWIEDFHEYSNQNPRVQSYAFEYAGEDQAKALDFLLPDGKLLDQVFNEQFESALKRDGSAESMSYLCSALTSLPSPVSIEHLATVTELNANRARDFLLELRGIRWSGNNVSFMDEDFEQFVREKGKAKKAEIDIAIANHMYESHTEDEYSAKHLARALYNAGRGDEIISLIENDADPSAISDPVLRREAQRQRLRIAMKVCRASGNVPDALYTILVGAEATKTDEVIQKTILENPDLAVHFSRDTIGRNILYNAKDVEHHGRFLFHLLAKDAQAADGISVREKTRMLHEWMQRRDENHAEQKLKHQYAEAWSIEITDIAAATEAKLRMEGIEEAVNSLLRWKPRFIHFRVALVLARNLITSGDAQLIREVLDKLIIPEPWSFFLAVPLAVAGEAIDLKTLEQNLLHKACKRLIRANHFVRRFGEEGSEHEKFLDTVLAACEIGIARGGDSGALRPLLKLFIPDSWRRRDQISSFDYAKLDLGIRAFCLLERIDGNNPTLESYWLTPPEPKSRISKSDREQYEKIDREKQDELKTIIGPLITVYDCRAQVLLNLIDSAQIEEEVNQALEYFQGESWRMSQRHHIGAVTMKVGQAIANLGAVPSCKPDVVFRLTQSVFKGWPNGFSNGQRKALSTLALIRSLHPTIQAEVNKMAKLVIEERTAASEKIEALLALSRIMLPINRNESQSLFNLAIGVANEVDVNAMHEIALFEPMAKSALEGLDTDLKRDVAHRVATITADAGIRLEGYDHFPWDKSVTAIASLDISQALAVVGLWEDRGIESRYLTLPLVINVGLDSGELSPILATGLLNLIDGTDTDLVGKILSNADQSAIAPITEELARLGLQQFHNTGRTTVYENMISRMHSSDSAGYWIGQLEKVCSYRERHEESDDTMGTPSADEVSQLDTDKSQLPTGVDWSRYDFNVDASIVSLLRDVTLLATQQKTYISHFKVICEAGKYVELGDQIAFIEVLESKALKEEMAHDWTRSILYFLDIWSESSLAIRDHKRNYLPIMIQEHLPEFSRYLPFGESPLPSLLDSLGLSNSEIVNLLLTGIEENSEHFDVGTLYALVGLISKYTASGHAAEIIDRYSTRLLKRVPKKDREMLKLGDLPSEITESFARFIYALMGDVDVRIRWRAAHAVRCVVRLGDKNSLSGLTALYDKKSEPNYRDPDSPFYWIAARLWLLITLNRLAKESLSSITPLIPFLLQVGTDDDFPHLLVRNYAKQTLSSLSDSGADLLTPGQKTTTDAINTSPIARKEANQKYHRVDRFRKNKERFQFDSLDTLPYWYSSAVRIFADVDQEEFLRMAEHWIIDCWSEKNSVWLWDWQKRISRFSEGDYRLWSHSHGSMPTIERYNNYLEWHAMWCAAGELMKSKPLALPDDDEEYGTLDYWLSNAGLTDPPLWLSDLRSGKPLRQNIWFSPADLNSAWINGVWSDDFLIELGLDDDKAAIVVDSYHQNRWENHSFNVGVSSALVSPSTTDSLMRALQSASDSRDYRLPPHGHDLEIDQSPFQLLGWLTEGGGDGGADEFDSIRNGVGRMSSRPAADVIQRLGIVYRFEHIPTWADAKSGLPIFKYQAWGDVSEDENERYRIYGSDPESRGHQLSIDRAALSTYLNEVGFELVMEVQITREKVQDRYSRYDEEDEQQARFAKIIILKRDGGIYSTEGRIGTWRPSS